MSKYTLELRRIHQTYKIFDFDYDFYTNDETIKYNFEDKFINEYYFNEIGFETVGRFKQRLRTKLNKIMPYYSQLYQTELRSKDIDFMLNKDLEEVYERVLEGSNTSKNDVTVDNNSTSNVLESNIDNGNASLELEKGSLTNVGKSTLSDNTKSSNSINDTTNQTERTILTSKGNIGVTSSAELLEKWRKVIINIDDLIINECSDLFMQVY